jgi:hypothetical protein
MKSNAAWLAGALMLTALLACRFSTNSNSNSNANSNSNTNSNLSAIEQLSMAKDDGKGAPGDKTNTFRPSDRTVHCLAKLRTPKEGTKVKFAWWAVDVGGAEPEMLKEIEFTTPGIEETVHGHLRSPRNWPKGKYRCDVYVNDVLDKTIVFYVS